MMDQLIGLMEEEERMMVVECDGKICALGLGAAKADTCALSSTATLSLRTLENRALTALAPIQEFY